MTVLSTLDVTKRFKIPGQKPIEVLKGVSFSVREGEKVAIIGRSGAGKSTLLNILGGLLKPTSGTVVRPKNFGFVFQSYHLMPELTVLENVLLPTMARRAAALATRAASEARARDLIEKVGLGKRLDHLPAELSGGERQRVALARALVTDPALVLADEPTGNLDAMTGADILRMLSELSGDGKTSLVMVTHSPAAAAVCDRTLSLEDGVLVRKG
jgi:ABC-type lipoprotein export system ATPase subunit